MDPSSLPQLWKPVRGQQTPLDQKDFSGVLARTNTVLNTVLATGSADRSGARTRAVPPALAAGRRVRGTAQLPRTPRAPPGPPVCCRARAQNKTHHTKHKAVQTP